MSFSNFAAFREKSIDSLKESIINSKKEIEILKKEKDTQNATEKFSDVIKYAYEFTGRKFVKDCNIYTTTKKAVKKIDPSKNKKYSLSIAFFSLVTKDIFLIEDSYLNFYYYPQTKNKDKSKMPIEKMYKPDRYTIKSWIKEKNKAAVLHEIFHFVMAYNTNTNDVWLHEHYAYSSMIGWGRDIGLSDEEIINGFLLSYTLMLVSSRHDLEEKEIKKLAFEKGKKIVREFDAMNGKFQDSEEDSFESQNKFINIDL